MGIDNKEVNVDELDFEKLISKRNETQKVEKVEKNISKVISDNDVPPVQTQREATLVPETVNETPPTPPMEDEKKTIKKPKKGCGCVLIVLAVIIGFLVLMGIIGSGTETESTTQETTISETTSVVTQQATEDRVNTNAVDSVSDVLESVAEALQVPTDPIESGALESEKSSVFGEALLVNSDYIIPESDTVVLDINRVACMAPEQVELAYFEIYARHGVIFDYKILRGYFGAKPWYNGTISQSSFNDNQLNDTEKKNLAFLSGWIKELHDREILPEDNGILVGKNVWCTNTIQAHKSANPDSKIICLLPQGSSVILLGEKNGFFKADWNGTTIYIDGIYGRNLNYAYPEPMLSTTWGVTIQDNVPIVAATDYFGSEENTLGVLRLGARVRVIACGDEHAQIECAGRVGYIDLNLIDIEKYSHYASKIGIIDGTYKEAVRDDYPEIGKLSTEILKEYPERRDLYIDALKSQYGVYREWNSDNYSPIEDYCVRYVPLVNEKDFNENVLSEIEKENYDILTGKKEIKDYFAVNDSTWDGAFVSDSGVVVTFSVALNSYYDSYGDAWFHKDSNVELLETGWGNLSFIDEYLKHAKGEQVWNNEYYEVDYLLTGPDDLEVSITNGKEAWFSGHYKRDNSVSTKFTEEVGYQIVEAAQKGIVVPAQWAGEYLSDDEKKLRIYGATDLWFSFEIEGKDGLIYDVNVVYDGGDYRAASCQTSTEEGLFDFFFTFDGCNTIDIRTAPEGSWAEGTYVRR